MTTDTTTDRISRRVDVSPGRATAVAAAVLFTDMLLHGLAIPVLPLLPAVLEQGSAATGILFASYAVAMIVSTLFAGRIVDRRGPKRPLVAGLVVLTGATLLFSAGGPYWLLLLARFAQGIAGGIIAATTGFERRGQMMGVALSTISLGVLVGPPLAGFLVDAFGAASPFYVAAAVAALDLAALLCLVPGSPRQTDDPAGPLAVLKVPGSSAIVVTIAIGAAVLAAVQPVLPGHLGGRASSTAIGLLFGVAALAGIVANPVVGRFVAGTSPRVLIGAGVAMVAAALLVIGWAGNLWQTGVGMALLGISSALLLAPATTLMSEQGFRSQPPTLGGSFALYNLAYAAGLAAGPLLTGFGVQEVGFAAAMVIAAGVLAVFGSLSLVWTPRPSSGE